jgi:ATP-dependent Clp protease ATP-binding subunit ClpB
MSSLIAQSPPSSESIARLQSLGDFLRSQIVGQDSSLEQITRAVQRAEIGLRNKPGCVQGNFLLLGPTGVGKTEATLSCARFLFGDGHERCHRFDMAEFQSADSLGALLGVSKNQQGLLGDAIDRLNHLGGGFLLFDEIEKASKPLVQVFLGIMDAARVSMSTGEVKNLEKLYLIFTSNLGTADAIRMENLPYAALRRHVLHVAEEHFGAPIMGRFQEKVVFRRLSHETQLLICEKMLRKEIAHIEKVCGHPVSVASNVFPYLIRRGYDKTLGARPMKDAVEREVGNAVTVWMLAGNHMRSAAAILSADKDQLFMAGE